MRAAALVAQRWQRLSPQHLPPQRATRSRYNTADSVTRQLIRSVGCHSSSFGQRFPNGWPSGPRTGLLVGRGNPKTTFLSDQHRKLSTVVWAGESVLLRSCTPSQRDRGE